MNLRFTLTAAAIAAASTFASPALAHTISASATCEGASFTASRFPTGSTSLAQFGVTFTPPDGIGGTAGPLVNVSVPPAGAASHFLPWDLRGKGPIRVVIVGSYVAVDERGGPFLFTPAVLDCGPTPAPTPVPPEQVPTPAPPPATNAPERTVRIVIPRRPDRPPVRKARPIVTCQFVLAHYRGSARASMMRRHGIPRSCGRPYAPPVLG